MKEKFIEEITDNFSELFIETFMIRYLVDYDKNNLLEDLSITYKNLNLKLKKNIIKKLKNMGYNLKDINKYF